MTRVISLIIAIYILITEVLANEYFIDAYGEIVLREKIILPDEIEKVIIKSESYWVDNLGDYGEIFCVGGYDKIKNKVDLKMVCEGVNQNEEKFWGATSRTSDMEAGTGTFKYIAGNGKYKELIGIKCNFAIRYFRKTKSFYKHKCLLNNLNN